LHGSACRQHPPHGDPGDGERERPRARFVDEEAYAAAGGRIERNLSSEEVGARWLDVALLERLATEKLEALAAEKAASSCLAFARPTPESWAGYEVTRGLQRVPLETPPLSDEESAEVDASNPRPRS
jgi:ParB family chromosome partitioning protein